METHKTEGLFSTGGSILDCVMGEGWLASPDLKQSQPQFSMKPSYSLVAFALALALTPSPSFALPPAKETPAATSTGGATDAPAPKEELSGGQRLGRFFVGTARVVGTGLKKTGQAMGRGIDKMIEKGAPKSKEKP